MPLSVLHASKHSTDAASGSEPDVDIEAAPPALAAAADGSAPPQAQTQPPPQPEELDIEHQLVANDPRLWSAARKWLQLAMLSFGALIPTMAVSAALCFTRSQTGDAPQADGCVGCRKHRQTSSSLPLRSCRTT
jgi:hypothetical protein